MPSKLRLLAVPLLSLLLCSSGFGQSRPATAQPPAKIKVGVVVSLFTATGPSWTGGPYGFSHANVAQEFDDVAAFELYAVVDPDTQDDEQVLAAIRPYFPEGQQGRLVTDRTRKRSLSST